MPGNPYMPLYTGDWKKDPKLSMCSPATRGIWIDLLCSFHDARVSQITGTPDQLARLCRCDIGSMRSALSELLSTGTANVSQRDDSFTVLCRRMKNEQELSRKRAEAGSKGGAKSKQRENSPDIESEDEGSGLQRVREFSRGKGIKDSDADWFYWKGRGNGWTNGGKPILDWKATLLSWQRAGYLPSQRKQQQSQAYFPKKPAPKGEAYQPRPPGREVSDEEISKMQPIVRDAVEELKAKFKMP